MTDSADRLRAIAERQKCNAESPRDVICSVHGQHWLHCADALLSLLADASLPLDARQRAAHDSGEQPSPELSAGECDAGVGRVATDHIGGSTDMVADASSELRIMTHSRVADLRRQGHRIECKMFGRGDYRYRLVQSGTDANTKLLSDRSAGE